MLLQILLFSFIVWLSVRWWQRRRKIQCCEQFKNDIWSMPVFGHGYLLLGNAEKRMAGFKTLGREALKQGGVTSSHTWMFDQFFIVVADPVTAEAVLKNCLEKDDSMKMFKSILGDGLLSCSVPTWRPRRKILNQTFSLKNLNQFVEIFRKNSKVMVETLANEADMGPFSIYDYISSYSLDSVCETLLGTELGSQKNHHHPVMQALNDCCHLIAHRMVLPLLYNQTVYDMTPQSGLLKQNAAILTEFIGKFITEKLQQYNNKAPLNGTDDSQHHPQDTGPKTILQLMIENSNSHDSATQEYLLDETFVVAFAGTDTTAVAFSFIMMMFASYPDVQEKVYNEISEVLGDITKPIEPEHLPRLKYTEAVIKETIRLYPPAPINLRKVDRDLVLPNGKTLVEGVGVMINIWAVHRNTQYWGADAEQFRPERFLEPLTHPAAFLGFSYGVRNCIGYQYAIMSLKTSITSVLREFRVKSAIKKTGKQDPMRLQMDIMLRDVDNFRIQLKCR